MFQTYITAGATKYGIWYMLELLTADFIIHLCVRTEESDIGMTVLYSFVHTTFSEQTRK
jgi:hypothetical protein